MNSVPSSETQDFSTQAKKAALSRWKLETLTALLSYRAANHHQKEREKNIEAENKRVRKELWGDCGGEQDSGDDMGNTILGDYHPPQVIVAGGQQSSGLGKVLAGAALGASLFGIPGAGVAGYFLSQMNQPKANATAAQADGETVDLGLKKIEDLEL